MKCLEITLDNAMYCQKLVFDNLSFICHNKTLDKSPLTRQLREAQRIANDAASGQLINGRNALLRPSSSWLLWTS